MRSGRRSRPRWSFAPLLVIGLVLALPVPAAALPVPAAALPVPAAAPWARAAAVPVPAAAVLPPAVAATAAPVICLPLIGPAPTIPVRAVPKAGAVVASWLHPGDPQVVLYRVAAVAEPTTPGRPAPTWVTLTPSSRCGIVTVTLTRLLRSSRYEVWLVARLRNLETGGTFDLMVGRSPAVRTL